VHCLSVTVEKIEIESVRESEPGLHGLRAFAQVVR